MISIKVSNSFKNDLLHKYLSLDNIEINEYILNIGLKFLEIKRNEKNCNYKNYNINVTSIIDYYEKKINDLTNINKNNSLENKYIINHIDKKYNDFYSKLNSSHDNYSLTLSKSIDPINNQLNDLKNNFFSFFSKFENGNTEKGNFGEKFIENYLYDKFSNCRITDTHKTTSAGDLLFQYDNLRLLIESKNVNTIKKEDVSKFYRDIQVRTDNNEINAALFVSLNNCKLPHESRYFSFEIKNEIPIIFISNIFQNSELLRIGILILNYISKFIQNYSQNISIQNILNELENGISLINKQFEYIEHDKKLIIKFQQNISCKEKDLNSLLSLITNSIKKNNLIKHELQDEDTSDIIFNKIKQIYNENPNTTFTMKTLQDFDISNHAVKKLGGIKKINQIINDEKNKNKCISL